MIKILSFESCKYLLDKFVNFLLSEKVMGYDHEVIHILNLIMKDALNIFAKISPENKNFETPSNLFDDESFACIARWFKFKLLDTKISIVLEAYKSKYLSIMFHSFLFKKFNPLSPKKSSLK